MAAPKRNPAQRDKDRATVTELYLQGKTQASIAELLGVSQSQISQDLKAIRRVWVKEAVRDFDELKSRELAKIDRLELEYWEAWKRSQEDAEVETEKAIGDKEKPTRVEKSKRKEGQAGDPRFLQGVQWCIEQRCKILGLNAPTKTQNLEIDYSELSDDELDRIIAGEDPAIVCADSRKRRAREAAARRDMPASGEGAGGATTTDAA